MAIPAKLKCFHITIPECKYFAVSYAARPEKALKDALNIAFDRRGIKCFRLDNREFNDATRFINYIKSVNRMDVYVKETKPA